MEKFDIKNIKNPESIKIYTITKGEISGIIGVHTLNKDSRGFYLVKTIINTPNGSFYLSERVNPEMLADNKELTIGVFFEDCIRKYEESIS